MPIEVEQKFPIAIPADFEQRLSGLGQVAPEIELQRDAYFNHPARDFATTDEALRLRRIGTRNFLTYKGPKLDTTTKTRREIEIELSPGDTAAEDAADLLRALGFVPVAMVHKQRRHAHVHWRGRDVVVAMDEVDELGSFVELEIVAAEGEIENARECLVSLASHLGLANAERRSYLELLLSQSH